MTAMAIQQTFGHRAILSGVAIGPMRAGWRLTARVAGELLAELLAAHPLRDHRVMPSPCMVTP